VTLGHVFRAYKPNPGLPSKNYSLLFAIVLLVNLFGCTDRGRQAESRAQIGTQFPAAELAALDDGTGRIVGAAGEKVQVINFWANWCEPCRNEMPSLQRLSEKLDPNKYSVVGVTVDEDRYLALEFLLEHEISFKNYHDEGMKFTTDVLGIEAFPVTFIVAPDGKILERVSGEKAWDSNPYFNTVKNAYPEL
jgi:thiol-disulfide isomerase/thioredoxin